MVSCEKVLRVSIVVGNIRIKIGCWRGGVSGVVQFLVAVGPHGLTERSKLGERRNHPRAGLWCFGVGVRDLAGSLEETPRETQVAAKKGPVNAFLFVKSLLDQQLSGINGQGLREVGQPMCETFPQDQTCREPRYYREYLAAPDIECALEKDIGERDHGLSELSYRRGRTRSRHRWTSQT